MLKIPHCPASTAVNKLKTPDAFMAEAHCGWGCVEQANSPFSCDKSRLEWRRPEATELDDMFKKAPNHDERKMDAFQNNWWVVVPHLSGEGC